MRYHCAKEKLVFRSTMARAYQIVGSNLVYRKDSPKPPLYGQKKNHLIRRAGCGAAAEMVVRIESLDSSRELEVLARWSAVYQIYVTHCTESHHLEALEMCLGIG